MNQDLIDAFGRQYYELARQTQVLLNQQPRKACRKKLQELAEWTKIPFGNLTF